MNRLLLGIIACLLILIGVGGFFLKHEISSNAVNKQQVEQLSRSVNNYQIVLDMQNDLQKSINLQVTYTIEAKNASNQRLKIINQKVDETSAKLKEGKITSSAADAAYLNSMWSAYCEANPSDSECNGKSSK